MGTGYIRQDSANDIANGNIIDADDLDAEFDALSSAFDASTGHTHDGTSAEGGAVTVLGPAQEALQDGTAFYPKTDDTYDLGKSATEWKDLYIDGVAYIDTLDLAGGQVTSIDTDLSSVSASDDTLASAKAIKTYVDDLVTSQDLDFQGDSGGALSIDLDSEILVIEGGTGIDTTGTLNTLSVAIDSTVATLTGTQTLTGKTIDLTDNTVSGTLAEFNTALSDGSFASLAGTETLTNKTVNLLSNTLTGTLAEFNTAMSDGSFASLAGTETLTNKTLTSPTVNSGTIAGTVSASANITFTGDWDISSLGNKATVRSDLGLGGLAELDILDEDDFASDSATRPPSQQSAAAYVATQIAAQPITQKFTSAEQTITAGGALTIPHSLGEEPDLFQASLICKSAELGYSVGDKVILNNSLNANNVVSAGQSIVPDATNINVRFGVTSYVYIILRKDTGVAATIDPTKWKLIVKAWV